MIIFPILNGLSKGSQQGEGGSHKPVVKVRIEWRLLYLVGVFFEVSSKLFTSPRYLFKQGTSRCKYLGDWRKQGTSRCKQGTPPRIGEKIQTALPLSLLPKKLSKKKQLDKLKVHT